MGTTTVRFYGKQLCSVPYADYINGSNTRDLSYVYNQLGNITSNTSTLTGDTDVTGYVYCAGAAGPHAVTSATIDGIGHTLTYDLNGAVTKYDIAGTGDDKYIAYNAASQPKKIVIGGSLTDTTPVAKDEFAYAPDGKRYARKSSWQEGGATITEQVSYIGAVEIISDNASASIQTITKTRLSANVMHVKIVGSVTEEFFEYAHRDHLGSIEVVTDDNGNVLDNLGFEPFGSRKTKDWTANISSTELGALLDLDWDHTRKARGFTGHEHLDRTGFIHMNGRVYDPVLGRFLSPDPIVQLPAFSQSWNRYSYVSNSPLSLVDPSGFIVNWPGNTDGGWFQPTFLEFLYLFGVYDPRQDDLILYANGCYAGCAAPIDPFANEISQTETTVYSGTIFVGPGASITGSLFGKHGGFEGSIAAAVTIGPGEWDIGLIRITGTPTDDLPIAANVGADIVFGVINRSIRNMEGKGITINLMIPVPGTLLSASGSEFETLEGRRIGGQFGIGTPGFGVSITETNTSTYSVRNAIISLRRRLTDSFCQLDANCQ